MNILENNRLQEALLEAYDTELTELETVAESAPHDFSEDFLNKMNKVIKMSGHSYGTLFRRKIRRSSLAALIAILVMCLAITAYAIIKEHINFNVSRQNANGRGLEVLTRRSTEEEVQESFEYIYPKTPEGFHIEETTENPLSLDILYESDSGSWIIYSQVFGEGGETDVNAPDVDFKEDTINERNALINRSSETYNTIIIEDGTNVFTIIGHCDFDILHSMAEEVTDAGSKSFN